MYERNFGSTRESLKQLYNFDIGICPPHRSPTIESTSQQLKRKSVNPSWFNARENPCFWLVRLFVVFKQLHPQLHRPVNMNAFQSLLGNYPATSSIDAIVTFGIRSE